MDIESFPSSIGSFIAENPVNALIFAVAFSWMLFFALLDHRSLKRGNHNDHKSVIVSIGVLGTFIGIFLGLWYFDTEDIDGSVPKLLDGLKLAFLTSIAGMLISILLSWLQRNAIIGGDDELAILNRINENLSKLDSLPQLEEQLKGIRLEFRDEQRQTRLSAETGFQGVKDGLGALAKISATAAKDESLNSFRIDVHEEQLRARNFIEEQFKTTNQSLKEAIDVLSKGATEEIIRALENVIADFNKNLVDQFGDNFKQLNEAVAKLLTWQEQYKEIVEKDYGLLIEIRESLVQSSNTLELIATRNDEFRTVYEQLGTLIRTYDTQLLSLNQQLDQYAKMGEKATAAFASLESGFEKVQTGLGSQSEAISSLTKDIERKLPEALGQLENTLVGLTTQFATDYSSFLDNYRKLVE